MRLSPTQRTMLANAKALIATVSRQAELAKDAPLAHALAEVQGAVHSIIERSRGEGAGPRAALRVLPVLLAAALGSGCAVISPGYIAPRRAHLPALIESARRAPLDSGALRRLAADAGLPLPARGVVVFVVPGRTFACPFREWERCYGAYLAADAGADLVLVAAGAPGPESLLRHELLHFLLHDGAHGPLFRRLGLAGLDGP